MMIGNRPKKVSQIYVAGSFLRAKQCGYRVSPVEAGRQQEASYAGHRVCSKIIIKSLPKESTDWATTQNNLGNALRVIGESKNDAGLLIQAKDTYD